MSNTHTEADLGPVITLILKWAKDHNTDIDDDLQDDINRCLRLYPYQYQKSLRQRCLGIKGHSSEQNERLRLLVIEILQAVLIVERTEREQISEKIKALQDKL